MKKDRTRGKHFFIIYILALLSFLHVAFGLEAKTAYVIVQLVPLEKRIYIYFLINAYFYRSLRLCLAMLEKNESF